jgi:integrase/recombinase XerD
MRAEPGCFSPNSAPLESWPLAHQQAWRRAFVPGGLFDAPGLAANWRPDSTKKTRKGYGVWIHWNQRRRPEILVTMETSRPQDLVTHEAIRAYVEDLRAINSSMTVYNRIQELHDAIRVMAPSAVEAEWLKIAFHNLRQDAKPSRNKLARLQSAGALEALGMRLMAQAEAAPASDSRLGDGLTLLERALAYRDGLMIALLIRRPLRIKNFVALTLGDNLVVDVGHANLAFEAKAMKGKRPMESSFPAFLFPYLQRYLDHYRPILLTASAKAKGISSNKLWISRDGTELVEISLHEAIRRRTKAAFGKPVPPHWFRDSCVTTLVRDEPASARLSGSVLGHTSPDIANTHYNSACMIDSARRHINVIDQWRGASPTMEGTR